jgi:RNA polymerase sigma-70 factor (ECF subfamily)
MSSAVARSESSSGLSLAARLHDGSAAAWRELVDLYGPLIESWCRQAGVGEATRADIGQEVLLAVHRGIASFDPAHPRATFRGWLWTITRNAILQWRRRQEPGGTGGSTALARLAEIPDPDGEAEWDAPPADSNDTANLIARALDQIQPEVQEHTWKAFWNTAFLGHSAPEVALELGMTPMAVRQAKSRVLCRLRKQLGDV